MLTKRHVGGNVYIGDECVGSMSETDERDIPPMLVMGMPVVFRKIVTAFECHSSE